MKSRRQFLTYLGVGTYALMRDLSALPASFSSRRAPKGFPKLFSPIKASREDKLLLPRGFKYDLLARWEDPLGSSGPFGPEKFGTDSDFTCYFPIDALKGGRNSNEGLLWVNHENITPLFFGKSSDKPADQVKAERLALGGSVLHLERKKGSWQRKIDSPYTRRYTGLYPMIPLSGPGKDLIPHAVGTLANCSGGKTPWNTVLSCEENFHNFLPGMKGTEWPNGTIHAEEYGWVVELDPFGELPPLKHSALGRFAHENCALKVGPSGKIVVYMGDDSEDQYLYKFVSHEKWNAKQTRAEQRKLLESGVLYAADFLNGTWLPLDLSLSPELGAAGFKTQAQVLVETRKAAAALKATPTDRPEDCEIHPLDGSIYIAFTNNKKHGHFHGQILRLVEENPEADKFQFEVFLTGGSGSGVAAPDNLAFDKKGNLWVTCDVGGETLKNSAYQWVGNNGLFYVPTRGSLSGEAFQFASAPIDAELTGPWFNNAEDTLFLSVQHPGETSKSLTALTSHWPEGGDALPRGSVVAITGF